MSAQFSDFVTWAPRVLGLLFAAFLAVFALDVFGQGTGFWATLVALVMHLLPTTFLVLVVVAVAWRWEWVGGVVFIALVAVYVVGTWGRMHWSAYLAIGGPLLLVGVLYLVSWWMHRGGGAGAPV